MSASATAIAVTCRDIGESDTAFTTALHHACRLQDFAMAGLDDALLQLLLDQQLHAREVSYRTRQHLHDQVIEVREGGTVVPVGRLTVDDGPDELRIVDLAVLPQRRRQGIATAALVTVLAQHTGRVVALRVRHENPALRIYERLGFVVVGSDELDLHMELTR